MTFASPSQAAAAEPVSGSFEGSVCRAFVGIENYHQRIFPVLVFKTFKEIRGSFKFSDSHTYMGAV